MKNRAKQPDTDADRELRACLDAAPPTSFIMVAGAGSGKTTSLVKALDHIQKSRGRELRRRGQRIACITYTEIAAREIALDVGDELLFHVSTIHSFLWTVIRPFQEDIRAWVAQRLQRKTNERHVKLANRKTKAATRERAKLDIARYREQMTALPGVSRFTYGTGSDYVNGILGHSDILKMVPQVLSEKPLFRTIMAQRFPFVFVDESQDTDRSFVRALKAVYDQKKGSFCVGFFGDPMQQIYSVGVGAIDAEPGWKFITKRENFRCPRAVLSVINRIRAAGDGLKQVRGRTVKRDGVDVAVEGTVTFRIFPADARRAERLETLHNEVLKHDSAPDSVRVLVLVHRMAAERLGFGDLFSALHDKSPEWLKTAFVEGTAWPLRPFLLYLLPLASAFDAHEYFEVMNLLRKHCPSLRPGALENSKLSKQLATFRVAIEGLHALLRSNDASILQVLQHARETGLVSLDERIAQHIDNISNGDDEADDSQAEASAIQACLACPAAQLWGYRKYIERESPFATQQGIKGAEYETVFVVLDDDEGREHTQFSYEKYFGVKPLSATDRKNQSAGKDSVLDRTRRLFYVCCSRALQDLVVVWFANDVHAAERAVRAMGIFEGQGAQAQPSA